MKRCTFIQSGEKILCVLHMSVEKWLDSAPFKEVYLHVRKFGRHM